MFRYALILVFAATAAAFAQDRIEVDIDTAQKPWNHLEVNNNPDQFQFAIVTDRTGGHRPGVFEDGVRKLNLLQPEFVMSVGDLIEGYTEDPEQIDREWTEFIGFIEQLEMPFFYVPGNHDLSNEVMVEEWKKRFGKLWYHFVYKDVLFLCLDSEDPPDTQMSETQAAYVQTVLARHPDVRWTLVFLHKPMWNRGQDSQGWQKIEQSLQGRPYTMFAGHTHDYYKQVRHDAQYITLATNGRRQRITRAELRRV
ncbi:MAG: metallophosphoesterase [Candidatus Hydrogenedentales bacterium]